MRQCDIDDKKVKVAQQQYGATAVAAGDIHRVEADVYSPCALGAVLNPRTIPEIQAKIVAGAANNQLSDSDQDKNLRERGILYCPDYIVNAGGVLSVADKGARFTRADALKRVANILGTTRKVLELAKDQGIPTGAAADRLALLRLQS